MPRKYKTKRRSIARSPLFKSVVGLIVVAVVIVGALQLTHTIHWFSKAKPASQVITTAGNITPALKNNSSAGTNPTKPSSTDSNPAANKIVGSATDTNGTASTTTSKSQWITSASGAITVKQPIANATIQNGSVLSGSATVSQVQYTLTDNSVGVISQGTLNVVNGNFSGDIEFTAHASSGRLDVYSTATLGGPEENLIEIAVNY